MKKVRFVAATFISAALLAACGGGGGSGGSVDLQLAPDWQANSKISHGNESRALEAGIDLNIWELLSEPGKETYFFSWHFIDLDDDGDLDLFVAQGVPTTAPGNSASSPLTTPMKGFRNDGGTFVRDDSLLGSDIPDGEHPRKTLAMDFNGDGQEDIMVLDHGYDAHPFRGSHTRYLRSVVSDEDGSISYRRDNSLTRVGFHHCGAAGDIDNDGDIDVFVGSERPFFYVNDGLGNFTEVRNRIENPGSTVYTCELIDLDGDGYLDILIGGHEWRFVSSTSMVEDASTAILWGDSTGTWNNSRRTTLPMVPGYGVVLDFTAADLNQSGHLDLFITRASGMIPDKDKFYERNYMQVLVQGADRTFTDETTLRLDKYEGEMPCGSSVAVQNGGVVDIHVPSSYGNSFAQCDVRWNHVANGIFEAAGVGAELYWGTLSDD